MSAAPVLRFLSREGLERLVSGIAESRDTYAPLEEAGDVVLRRVPAGDAGRVRWNGIRLAAPLKPLWFPPSRVVARWGPDGPDHAPPTRPRAVVGAKACDLAALAVMDRVFRDHEYREPSWCAAREADLIVSGDCTDCGESCFCALLGVSPWPKDGFDLNVSPLGSGYLVEVGSGAGRRVVDLHHGLFRHVDGRHQEERDRRRREVEARVTKRNGRLRPRISPSEIVARSLRSPIWGELASSCVECGACNYICPTCHCFQILDSAAGDGFQRLLLWDACSHAGYARMAGGGTPRLQLHERFKNHYLHKFVSFPRNWGVTACTGCGRCVDACPGGIDKRETLHTLETRWIPAGDGEGA